MKRTNCLLQNLLLAIGLPIAALAQNFNPIIPDNIADPSISKFGDTYYLYSTTDMDFGLSRAGTPVVWKSKDFVNWSFNKSPITGFNWSKEYKFQNKKGEQQSGYFRFWAPGKVIKKGDTYYLYVTIVKPEIKKFTYVMVSNSPEGPFRFAEGDGLFAPGETKADSQPIAPDIDGEPYIDDNGKGYLFWRKRRAVALADDLIHTQGDYLEIKTNRKGYSEGPTMFKRKGIYYYIYTLWGHQNYANAYMMSKEGPLSGFETPANNDIFIFSAPQNNVWGPGHGNVFYNEDTNEYIFIYLEYGDGGTTRQVYANKMEFNDDGTIKTLIPDCKGVGYLAKSQETRENLALKATFIASSVLEPRTTTVQMETQPNAPLVDSASVKTVSRTHSYEAAHAGDNSYGTRWIAARNDTSPWIIIDLGKVEKVNECQFFFNQPTEGQAWKLEKSTDGKNWNVCAEQSSILIRSPHIVQKIGKARYLNLHITKGNAGLWEWKIYR